MTRTIENSFLKISVSDHGAELTGIYDKTNDREILWQAIRLTGNAMRLYFFPTWDVTTKISGV